MVSSDAFRLQKMNLFSVDSHCKSFQPLSSADFDKFLKAFSKLTILSFLSFSVITLPPTIDPSFAAVKLSYLKETTDEFKEQEKLTAQLKSKQAEIRKEWDSIIEEIRNSNSGKNTEEQLIKLNNLLVRIQTIPSGVKKLDLVKVSEPVVLIWV